MPRLDPYYTADDVAAQCVAWARAAIPFEPASWVEPSAGGGAFLAHLPPGAVGLDIAPTAPGILTADFLSWVPPPARPAAVVGNPPFGKNASLAVRFFNRAAAFAEAIAFIVPRTFEKDSLARRLDRAFALAARHPIPPFSFLLGGVPCDVPCVFDVWLRSAAVRAHAPRRAAHPDFAFVPDPADADFAFQRVGANAGKVSVEGLAKSPQPRCFIAASPLVRARLESLDWSAAKARTAGCPSIGKAEIVEAYG